MRKQNGAGGASIGRTMARRRSRRQGTAGLSLAADHPCFGCAQCCKYIAIEIDAPTTMQEYDYLVWYLVHPGVSVFVDFDNAWFVKFDSRCQHLQPSGMCGIYETRPAICREFSHTDCERHLKDEPADKWLFTSSEEFLGWLEKQRPKSFQRFRAFQTQHRRKKTPKELRRVRIADLPAPPALL